jgi:hypothetical protein
VTTGPRADSCVEALHTHVGICQRAGYANGWADLAERIEAYLAEPDDRQEWEYVPGEVTTVDVVRVDAIRALLGLAAEPDLSDIQEPPC